MVCVSFKFIFVCYFIVALSQFGSAQSEPGLWASIATRINTWTFALVDLVAPSFARTVGAEQSETTKALCKRNTDELIEYYGYKSEVHNVTTKDGYILKVFRCNSNKAFSGTKKVVILQHGLLSSSDDFTVNIPGQALAYVLADEGYDVWMSNSRGTFYSRHHVTLEPSSPQFWNFTYYELAMYDYPAIIDYVRHETGIPKVFIIATSQGTTTLMTLLSEQPEYNQYVAAASFLAPVGYIGNSGIVLTALSKASPILKLFKYTEFLPRAGVSDIAESFCSIDVTNFCNLIIDQLFGQSVDQRNETMMNAFLCKIPSGASTMQFIHFGQQVNYGFFGKYMDGSEVPSDFDLSRINVPISLHYSPIDKFTNEEDVKRLILKLSHTVEFIQKLESPHFNHADYVWGKHAASIIYKRVIEFFANY